jgi:hypothetical protein
MTNGRARRSQDAPFADRESVVKARRWAARRARLVVA